MKFDQVYEKYPDAVNYLASLTSDPSRTLMNWQFRDAVMKISEAAISKSTSSAIQEWQPNQIDTELLKLSWKLYGKPYQMLKVHELRDVKARYLKLKE